MGPMTREQMEAKLPLWKTRKLKLKIVSVNLPDTLIRDKAKEASVKSADSSEISLVKKR